MKMWRSLSKICGVVVLVAVSACPADEVEPGPENPPPPTEEEIQAVWEGMCDLYLSDVRVMRCEVEEIPDLEAAREACLMGQHDLYYCMPGCVEPNYAAEKCLVEAHAELDYSDPLNEYYLCEMSAPECEDLLGARYDVTCGGCDWSGALATSGGTEEGGGT
jgi:hypothetical protein